LRASFRPKAMLSNECNVRARALLLSGRLGLP
jgi:hypothetical protein